MLNTGHAWSFKKLLPFDIGELLLVLERAAASLRPESEQDEEREQEDGEDAADDHRNGNQDLRGQVL
jgi:hypothetical protein